MSIAIIRGRIGNVKKRLSSLPISHKNTLLFLCNYDNIINVLLYSYRLCQVARLIDITVALHCDIVCQKLHRNNRKRSGKFIQHFGRRTMCWQTDSSPVKSSVVTSTTLAPRATTSRILETVFSNSAGCVARATTRVPSSIREMVPCLSSPAAYASE